MGAGGLLEKNLCNKGQAQRIQNMDADLRVIDCI